MAKKDSSTRIRKRSQKFPVSLEDDLFQFVVEEAKSRYGGNRSAMIAEAIRDAKERDDSPFASRLSASSG
jgi:metal-responsive CopG/Arc/MetJ family transcriptional regulator